MSARTIAGWTALVSGALLVLAMLFASTGAAIGAAVMGFPMSPGMMGPGMMSGMHGMMGRGMMRSPM